MQQQPQQVDNINNDIVGGNEDEEEPQQPPERALPEEGVARGDDDDDGDDDDQAADVPPNGNVLDQLLGLPTISGMDDPRRMDISRQERQWALAIKNAIAQHPEIDNVSDFMCAQLALIEEDNVERALERAQTLQYFREEYKVVDNLEAGRHFLRAIVNIFPRHYLSIDYHAQTHSYVFIYDVTKFDLSVYGSTEKVRSWFCGSYFFLHAWNPDLYAVRKGITMLVECEGYSFSKVIGMDFKTHQKIWDELSGVYPQRFDQVKHFHTGVLFNVMASMVRRMLPVNMRSRFHVGCDFGARLDTLYLVPNEEEASQRFIARMEDSLVRRYANEKMFKL